MFPTRMAWEYGRVGELGVDGFPGDGCLCEEGGAWQARKRRGSRICGSSGHGFLSAEGITLVVSDVRSSGERYRRN